MSKTKEELWSRFLVTNYQDLYYDESDIRSLLSTYYDLEKIFQTLEIMVEDTGEVVIKNCGDVLTKLSDGAIGPFDDKGVYGGKQAILWRVVPADRSSTVNWTTDTNYELVFAKTSELLSGSGWVGNYWLVEGYFFCFSEGFSTMAGVLFKKDNQDRPIMQILLGEQAYEVYQEKIQQHQWDAINRRLI
jgi:hypothetical protein